MRLLRWRWLLVPLLVLSVGLLSRQFLALRHEADAGLTLAVLLSRSSALISDIEELEMQLIYEPAVQAEARRLELDTKRAEFKANLGRLDEYRWAAVDSIGLLA